MHVPDADPPPQEIAPGSLASEAAAAREFSIVGIGASAGGLEAASQLLQHLPAKTGMAFVLVQHLDPSHSSSLVELLAKTAQMPVVEVKDGTPVEVDYFYVIPPNTAMVIADGTLHLTPRQEGRGQHMPIDSFLRSLAKDRSHRAIGVVLSGTGSDGTLGLKSIKNEGGLTFAQDQSAKFDAMPRNAVAAGCVDFVLSPAAIAADLVRISDHPYVNHGLQKDGEKLTGAAETAYGRLFLAVRHATGVDFAPYKRGTVRRRVQRRMIVHQLDKLDDYVQYIEDHPAEARILYEDILIHVTSFFREPETFAALQTVTFPALMTDRPAQISLRFWVPGCSTGEEVYSVAIALLEFLGEKAANTPIKIFGTDISETAIDKARTGRYPNSIAADVTPERLRRFFIAVDGDYQIHKSIRDLCVFARQDVTRDPPFSSMDLISCRNVLIYLGPPLQKRVLPIFHYALKPSGYLLLGGSETIGLFSDLFTAIDAKHRIYARKPGVNRPGFDFVTPELTQSEVQHGGRQHLHSLTGLDLQREADRLVLAQYAPAGVVVNQDMEIVQSRGRTGPYLELAPGTASLNLLKMAREGLLLPLRSAVDEARQHHCTIRKRDIHLEVGGRPHRIDLVVNPFTVTTAAQTFFLILFEDAAAAPAAPDAEPALPAAPENEQVQHLRTELSATRNYLQSTIEELEASNEELKAANEEIVSSNEELRSTNEELQTAKEELQATNEELSTVNDELRHRHREASELNSDLTNLLSSVQIPIVMLGRDLQIRRFTPSAARVLHLIPTDVGRPIGDINSRIDLPDLLALIAEVVDNLTIKELEVRDREGRWYHLSIRPYRTVDDRIDGAVLTMVDVDALKRSEQRIFEAEAHLRAILDNAAEGILTLDGTAKIQTFNKAAQQMFGYNTEEALGKNVSSLLALPEGQEHPFDLADYLKLEESKSAGKVHELTGLRKDGPMFILELTVSELKGLQHTYVCIARDVTADREAHDRSLQAERLAAIGQLSAGMAHESRNALQRSQACLELLRRTVTDRPEALDLIARLQKAQDHLLHLYEEVRSYAAPLKLARQRQNLGALLEEVWGHLKADRQGRTAELHQHADNVDLHCAVDAERIGQVFRNILENALQSCPDPVRIDVVWLATEWEGTPALRIAITNNGPTLTPEEHQRIFEAFFTTKTHGTGLGMTIARRIVEAHGGSMEVGSEPRRQGVEIVLVLPRGKP